MPQARTLQRPSNGIWGHSVLLLQRAASLSRAALEARLEADGLSMPHVRVLARLQQEGAASQRQLSLELGIDRTTMVAVVDRLEELGYAKRSPDPTDRRLHRVDATPSGLDAAESIGRALDHAEAGFTSGLSAAERAALREALMRICGTEDAETSTFGPSPPSASDAVPPSGGRRAAAPRRPVWLD